MDKIRSMSYVIVKGTIHMLCALAATGMCIYNLFQKDWDGAAAWFAMSGVLILEINNFLDEQTALLDKLIITKKGGV